MQTKTQQPHHLRFVLTSVAPACLVGVVIMTLNSAPTIMPKTNLVALALGLVLVHFGAQPLCRFISKRPRTMALVFLAMLTSTLFGVGIEGIHRWVVLGPLRVNLSALLTPLLLGSISALWQAKRSWTAVGISLIALTVHLEQPDAGQATALATGLITLALVASKERLARAILVIGSLLLASWTWKRPDPLLPVPMVERILTLAFDWHPSLGVVSLLALGMLPLYVVRYTYQADRGSLRREYGLMFAAYIVSTIAVVVTGAFPTPLVGYGASPILGTIFGLGLLTQLPTSKLDDGRG